LRKVIAIEWMSIDGVVQAPAYPDEDMSGGFKHGGWHLQYFDDESMRWVVENTNAAGGYLFGRKTYETFAAYWPKAEKDEPMLARPLNSLPKYVASKTLKDPLAWRNSRLLEGDIASAVAELKREDGKDLYAIGSTGLVQTLMAHDLVDEFRLMIDPIILGGGKRFFKDDGVLRPWRLVESKVTGKGAILATYANHPK
jgi:dihydrofolate reductase